MLDSLILLDFFASFVLYFSAGNKGAKHGGKQQAENNNLKAELAWFRRKLFGSSSEHKKTDVEGQLNLFDDPVEDGKPVELIEPETVPQEKKTRRKKPALED